VLDITNEGSVANFFSGSGTFDHAVTTAGDWDKVRRGPLIEIDMNDAKAFFGVRVWAQPFCPIRRSIRR